MKKKKVGIIASSVAAIAVCSSMVVGSTFALFTSEDSVNIAVTSGKVNATASVTNVVTYSKDVEQEKVTVGNEERYMFALNGYATVSGNAVVLNNIMPMDKAEITVTIENESTVDVLYRTYFKVSEDTGLAEALVCTIDGVTYNGETGWHKFTESNKEEVTFSIELPETAGNEYQEKSCTVSYVVEAIQANAATQVTEDSTVTTYAVDGKLVTLNNAIKALQPGDKIELTDDVKVTKPVYYAKVADKADTAIIIEGNGHTIYGDTTAEPFNGHILDVDHKAEISNLNIVGTTGLAFGSGIRLKGVGNKLTNVSVVGSFNMAAVNLSLGEVTATLDNCYLRNTQRTEAVDGNLTFDVVYGNKVYSEYTFNQVCGNPYIGLFVSGSGKADAVTIKNCDIDNIAINGPVNNMRLIVEENNTIGAIYTSTPEDDGVTFEIKENADNKIDEIIYGDKSGNFPEVFEKMLADGTICEVTAAPTREGYEFAGWRAADGKIYKTYEDLMAFAAKAGNGTTFICLWEKAA